ncbi:hypothetical protein CSKR_202151 [Clonorchis sinensis]|uniref:Uncharacterized protein n=1 Tax=Clonorchis sinensis TaxID=79923 RepID=A0A8T1LXG9_CLOSI|nr:hypothetical protein CSKR_202151 [Clonorchis sinensis]
MHRRCNFVIHLCGWSCVVVMVPSVSPFGHSHVRSPLKSLFSACSTVPLPSPTLLPAHAHKGFDSRWLRMYWLIGFFLFGLLTADESSSLVRSNHPHAQTIRAGSRYFCQPPPFPGGQSSPISVFSLGPPFSTFLSPNEPSPILFDIVNNVKCQ